SGIARRLRGASDDEESVGRKALDGDVALIAAAGVEQRGIDDPARRHVHVVGAKVLEDGERVAALEEQFRERGLVEDCDTLARGALLGKAEGEPGRLGET